MTNAPEKNFTDDSVLALEELTPWQRVWRNLSKNHMAMGGGIILAIFFVLAVFGFWGTTDQQFYNDVSYMRPFVPALMRLGLVREKAYFDPSAVRLPDKLKAPFGKPNRRMVPPENLPRLGVYLFGTDELGRDVFARMLQGASTAMAVGFVAVGIAVILGVTMGGIAGFYGHRQPGGGSMIGFCSAMAVGFALWRDFGLLPCLGGFTGGLAGFFIRSDNRAHTLEGLALGFFVGLALSPLGPAPIEETHTTLGMALPEYGRWPFWLAIFSLAGYALLGGLVGLRAEGHAHSTAVLGAFIGGAIVYLVIFASGFFYSYPGRPIHWLAAIGSAVLCAWGAYQFSFIQYLRTLRLPRIDTLFTMLVDVQLSFPTFFLILTAIALLSPSIWNIMIVIGLTGWVGPARFVRAEILSLRERPFVESAMAVGANDWLIIFRHLVPNSLAPVLVSATIGIAGAILTESALSFLGFGVPPPQATWGNILSDGRKYLFDAPWLFSIPGTAILVVVLSFNLFGEGLREAMNPRSRPE